MIAKPYYLYKVYEGTCAAVVKLLLYWDPDN
jgi:hypothetical protein